MVVQIEKRIIRDVEKEMPRANSLQRIRWRSRFRFLPMESNGIYVAVLDENNDTPPGNADSISDL